MRVLRRTAACVNPFRFYENTVLFVQPPLEIVACVRSRLSSVATSSEIFLDP